MSTVSTSLPTRMKKTYTTLALLFFLLFFASARAQTVFISSSGKKYHSVECKMLKNDKKEMSYEAAQKEGYKACKICKAKEIDRIKKMEAKEKKKKENKSAS